jgi:hypothetical protein
MWQDTATFWASQGMAPITVAHPENNAAKYTQMSPAIRCPVCNCVVYGLADVVTEANPPAHPTKFNQVPVSGGTPGAVALVWRVSPCGHDVTAHFAGLLASEIVGRKETGICVDINGIYAPQLEQEGCKIHPTVAHIMQLGTAVDPKELGYQKPPIDPSKVIIKNHGTLLKPVAGKPTVADVPAAPLPSRQSDFLGQLGRRRRRQIDAP